LRVMREACTIAGANYNKLARSDQKVRCCPAWRDDVSAEILVRFGSLT